MKTMWIAVLALTLSGILAGCGGDGFSLISTQQEIAMGEEAQPQFEAEFGGKVADPALQAYVSQVGMKQAKASNRPDMPYEFALLNSDVPNAFALPGGKIYITRGLFQQMQNEAQLASVLGHEVGHVAARHNVKALERQMGLQTLANLAGIAIGGTAGEIAQVGTEVAGGMVTLSYSRDDERQADVLGMGYMNKTDYNPWGMVQMFEVLKSLSQSEPGRIGGMFQTHPLTSERIEDSRQRIKEEYPRWSSDQTNKLYPSEFMQMRSRLK